MAVPAIRISINTEKLHAQISGLVDLINKQQIICDDEFIESIIADVVMGDGAMVIFEDGEKGIVYPLAMGERFNSFIDALSIPQTTEHLN